MPEKETRYLFGLSERGVLAEIYFPKRAAYYGPIFDALRFGYDENEVKDYLRRNVKPLLEEFQALPDLFNPRRYSMAKPRRSLLSIKEALERIEAYKSPFKGWSVGSVDGVFFDSRGRMYEEATQVVKIIYRFKSSFAQEAITQGCFDVLRAILFWVISQRGHLADHQPWSKAEQTQFISRHKPWPKHKLSFVQRHFIPIATEVGKWMDDSILFVFGYLVRQFWEQVVKERLYEEEIWVTNLFDLVLNVVERVER